MRARWGAALGAAVALAAAGARAADESPCGLSGAIRMLTGSMTCVSCHDGTAATAISLVRTPDGAAASHPVGIDYADAALRHPGKYTPAANLPPEIVLVAGKVECTSCHDGRSPQRFKLAGQRELCLGCHRL
jgi:predicted CXXCH cytochrome family protein